MELQKIEKWIERGSSFHKEDRLNFKELILPKKQNIRVGLRDR